MCAMFSDDSERGCSDGAEQRLHGLCGPRHIKNLSFNWMTVLVFP